MNKLARITLLAALLASLLIFGTFSAFADCSVDDPDCPLNPPQSVEVDPDSVNADGSTTSVQDPGVLEQVQSDVSGEAPVFIDPLPLAQRAAIPNTFSKITIPMRWQQASDVSCGVQALGMAVEGLVGEGSPSSPAILDFLNDQDMMYDFGTGVEELAYAAQNFGYKGSVPFHNWSLKQLLDELGQGQPPVVTLGANGPGQPGHFVTLTGISADGAWVSYNDPILGEKVVTIEEFNRLWGLQGNSGVAVRKTVPAGEFDAVPWVAFAAGLMALISQTPLALQRKGIGGALIRHDGGREKQAKSRNRWIQQEVPVYAAQNVQDGWKLVPKVVVDTEKRYVQIGTRTETKTVPVYKDIRVQRGWTHSRVAVPRYRTVRYVKGYKTEWVQKPKYHYFGKYRVFVGYVKTAKKVPVYGTRRVRAGSTYRLERKPRYVIEKVRVGTRSVEREVPVYGWQEVQVGTHTEWDRVPRMVTRQVQVGVENRWSLTPDPDDPTPTINPLPPVGTPEPSYTPPAQGTTPPAQSSTVMPPIMHERNLYPRDYMPKKSDPYTVEDLAEDVPGKWPGRILKLGISFARASTARAIQFSALESGLYSVSATTLAEGTRRTALAKQGFNPGAYKPSTIASTSARNLLKKTFTKIPLGIGFLTSLAVNLWDYGLGNKRDKEIGSQEFYVSTGVDFGMSVGIGLVAAGVVGALASIAVGAGIIATAPVWLLAGATAAVGLSIGLVLDHFGATTAIKEKVNAFVDAVPGIVDNIEVIGEKLPGYVQEHVLEPIGDFVEEKIIEPVKDAVDSVIDTVSNAVSDIKDGVSSFIGGIFGGGG